MAFMDNGAAISEVILSGLCHRFPKLKCVSVESGVGWVPFLLEALDWQWLNNGGFLEHSEFDLLPSEYFRRQVYACFWFEQAGVGADVTIDVEAEDAVSTVRDATDGPGVDVVVAGRPSGGGFA